MPGLVVDRAACNRQIHQEGGFVWILHQGKAVGRGDAVDLARPGDGIGTGRVAGHIQSQCGLVAFIGVDQVDDVVMFARLDLALAAGGGALHQLEGPRTQLLLMPFIVLQLVRLDELHVLQRLHISGLGKLCSEAFKLRIADIALNGEKTAQRPQIALDQQGLVAQFLHQGSGLEPV